MIRLPGFHCWFLPRGSRENTECSKPGRRGSIVHSLFLRQADGEEESATWHSIGKHSLKDVPSVGIDTLVTLALC